MSQENVNRVLRGYRLASKGEHEAAWENVAPDFHIRDRTLPETTGEERGPDALRANRKQLDDSFDEISYEVEEVIDLDDRVLVRARARGRGKGSQISVEGTVGHLYVFRGGEIRSLDVYGTWQAALEAAGLSE